MTPTERAIWFADLVLRPTLAAYLDEEKLSRTSESARRQIYLGMLGVWKLLDLLAEARGETVKEAFKREAIDCFPLHIVRHFAVGGRKIVYPRWVRPRPRPDQPIDMGYCFVRGAERLLDSVAALPPDPSPAETRTPLRRPGGL
jgi:hypothetical protein